MAKYQTRTRVVEAVQWHTMGDHPAVVPCPLSDFPIINEANRLCGKIITPDGVRTVLPEDWIVTPTGTEDHYLCGPDVFLALHEIVT